MKVLIRADYVDGRAHRKTVGTVVGREQSEYGLDYLIQFLTGEIEPFSGHEFVNIDGSRASLNGQCFGIYRDGHLIGLNYEATAEAALALYRLGSVLPGLSARPYSLRSDKT